MQISTTCGTLNFVRRTLTTIINNSVYESLWFIIMNNSLLINSSLINKWNGPVPCAHLQYMRDLDFSSLQTKLYYWQTKIVISSSNVVRGRSQLSTFSLAYSFSWTLPHPESVQEDDPAISSGVMALFVFSVLAPWWPSQESDWTKIWYVSCSYLVVRMYHFGLIELSWFSKMAVWRPNLKSDRAEIW
jgi:hypothetical protein